MLKFEELKIFLDEKADQYNDPEFIENDPIQIPHRFSLKQDIEIAGFLAATISWGNRKAIIKSAEKMLDIMGNSPYDFVLNHSEKDLKFLEGKSVHRTLTEKILLILLSSLTEFIRKMKVWKIYSE
jgi:uncharacterized protein (TIGR02757 family)